MRPINWPTPFSTQFAGARVWSAVSAATGLLRDLAVIGLLSVGVGSDAYFFSFQAAQTLYILGLGGTRIVALTLRPEYLSTLGRVAPHEWWRAIGFRSFIVATVAASPVFIGSATFTTSRLTPMLGVLTAVSFLLRSAAELSCAALTARNKLAASAFAASLQNIAMLSCLLLFLLVGLRTPEIVMFGLALGYLINYGIAARLLNKAHTPSGARDRDDLRMRHTERTLGAALVLHNGGDLLEQVVLAQLGPGAVTVVSMARRLGNALPSLWINPVCASIMVGRFPPHTEPGQPRFTSLWKSLHQTFFECGALMVLALSLGLAAQRFGIIVLTPNTLYVTSLLSAASLVIWVVYTVNRAFLSAGHPKLPLVTLLPSFLSQLGSLLLSWWLRNYLFLAFGLLVGAIGSLAATLHLASVHLRSSGGSMFVRRIAVPISMLLSLAVVAAVA
jgi:hypothetical protein